MVVCHGDLKLTLSGLPVDIRAFSDLISCVRDVILSMGPPDMYIVEANAFSEAVQNQIDTLSMDVSDNLRVPHVLQFKTFHDWLSVPAVMLLLASTQFFEQCPSLTVEIQWQAVPGKSDVQYTGRFSYLRHTNSWKIEAGIPPEGFFWLGLSIPQWSECYQILYDKCHTDLKEPM